MTILRPLAAGMLSALSAFVVVHASGCGTEAVGVDECRDIEEARCEAGQYCGLVDDVETCKRFYRDQCLHGMASGERPGKPRVKECIATIQAAGQCAKEGHATLAECSAPPSVLTVHTTPCQIVTEPEGTKECEFLSKPVEVPDSGPDADQPDADQSDATDGDVSDAAPE